MSLPQVAIVGRPNVGKSSLFNWLANRRIAIVDPTAGVTRDRVATPVELDGHAFDLVDTGGIGIEDVDDLTEQIEQQIHAAIHEAAVLLFVVDIRSGVAPLDLDVAERLRRIGKPVILVANKCDTPNLDLLTGEFHRFGHGAPICVSTMHNRGKHDLAEAICEYLPEGGEAAPTVEMKLAIVGRRNTGKSTFINCVARSERMIVSEVAGTTRDSVDVRFERDGKVFIAIDTAGVRRKGSLQDDVEFYSMHRAERSIRRADVVLMFLDPRVRISKVDKQLAGYILDHHKPAVFVVNKWDLAQATIPTSKFGTYIKAVFPSLDYVPIAFITAKSGKNVQSVLNLAQTLYKQSSTRVTTGDLNRAIEKAVELQAPPLRQNRRPKIYYATQATTNPPTIVLFTNGAELFDNTYQRYLVKTLRDNLPFNDVPIKLVLRSKSRGEGGVPETAETRIARKAAREAKAEGMNLDDLDFQTELTDEDVERDRRSFEPGLWRDV